MRRWKESVTEPGPAGAAAEQTRFAALRTALGSRPQPAPEAPETLAAPDAAGNSAGRANRFGELVSLSGGYYNDAVLKQWIEQIKAVVGAGGGGVLLYDFGTNKLVLQYPAFGRDKENFFEYALDVVADEKPGIGAAVKVFLTGQPYISNKPLSDPVNRQEIVDYYGIQNALTIPLEVNQQRLGVLHLINKSSGGFSPEDARIASILASQAAVQIYNALNLAQLEEKNRLLARVLEISRQLTEAVLQGRGLAEVTALLARLVKLPVQVDDRFLKVQTFSVPPGVAGEEVKPEIPGEEALTAPALRDFLARLQREGRALLFPALSSGDNLRRPRLIAPVQAGGQTPGYVSLLAVGRYFEDFDFLALEQAALVYALYFQQEKFKFSAEEKIKEQFIQDLVGGLIKEEGELLRRAYYLGYNVHQQYYLMLIYLHNIHSFEESRPKEKNGAEPKADPDQPRQRRQQPAADLVFRCVAEKGLEAITACPNPLLLLINAGPDRPRKRVQELAEAIRQCLRSELAQTSLIAVSGPARSVRELPVYYRQAQKALNIARKMGWQDVIVPYESLGALRVLFCIEDQEVLKTYLEETLGAIIAYDREKNGHLLATLRAYAASNFNVRQTARRLFIHINTLKYRLQRIQEISGTDPDEPEVRFNLQLAMRILDMLENRADKETGPAL